MSIVTPEFARLKKSPFAPRAPLPPEIPLFACYTAFVSALLLGGLVSLWVANQFFWAGSDRIRDAGVITLGGAGLLSIGMISLLTGIRWCVLFVLSFREFLRVQRPCPYSITAWPLVSVFVPAFNESETIEAALESLIQLNYPNFEVIIVDDGSTDDTFDRARNFAGRHAQCMVRVYRKPNGGKWSAHNFAFARSTGELILCLDADSRIERDSLTRLVARMADPTVSGVSGQIRVRNRVNLLTKLQGLEYLMANGAMRMAQSFYGSVLVVPGPIGLFRRSVLEEVFIRFGQRSDLKIGEVAGPFEGDTFAEDFDLSLSVLSLGGRIIYEPHAISHTKSPDGMIALLNQRYRWARGTMQVLRKYVGRGMRDRSILHKRLLAWVTVTYLLELLVLPFVYFAGLAFLMMNLLGDGDLAPLLLWFSLFAITNLNAAALFAVMHGDRLSILQVLPFYDFYHGFVLNSGWLIAAVDEIRGVRMRW